MPQYFKRRLFGASVAATALLSTGLVFAQAGQTVKIAFIDPLSGPFANVGQNQLKGWQFSAEQFNKKNAAGVKFEIVPFDNKGSPQESLTVLKAAMDQGIRYVTQGNGSGAAGAISDAGASTRRRPGRVRLYSSSSPPFPRLPPRISARTLAEPKRLMIHSSESSKSFSRTSVELMYVAPTYRLSPMYLPPSTRANA
jgi:hypothetical protein